MSKKDVPQRTFEENALIELTLMNDRFFALLETLEEIHPGAAKIYNEKVKLWHTSSSKRLFGKPEK